MRVEGSGFRVQGLRFMGSSLGSKDFRFQNFGFKGRVPGLGLRVKGLGLRDYDLMFSIKGVGLRGQSLACRV